MYSNFDLAMILNLILKQKYFFNNYRSKNIPLFRKNNDLYKKIMQKQSTILQKLKKSKLVQNNELFKGATIKNKE